MWCEFPSEEERELVRKYVMERPLVRPPITFKKAAVNIFAFIAVNVIFALLTFFISFSLGIINVAKHKELLFIALFFLCFCVLFSFIIRKKIVVALIQLYQHYAPEDVRRRCLLKPTCSEYAILAVQKYGIIRGGIKTWIRLNYKCRGNVYYIDELE